MGFRVWGLGFGFGVRVWGLDQGLGAGSLSCKASGQPHAPHARAASRAFFFVARPSWGAGSQGNPSPLNPKP